jgi:glutamyl-tRNA synthetase
MQETRLRFPPSPTGYLHIGGARTALYNWLYARKTGGSLVLRIEDTDTDRSTEESIGGIIDGLTWLGIDWDEGPYFQTDFSDDHGNAAERLVQEGKAYHCFCTKETLEQKREAALAAKQNRSVTTAPAVHLPAELVEKSWPVGNTVRHSLQGA